MSKQYEFQKFNDIAVVLKEKGFDHDTKRYTVNFTVTLEANEVEYFLNSVEAFRDRFPEEAPYYISRLIEDYLYDW